MPFTFAERVLTDCMCVLPGKGYHPRVLREPFHSPVVREVLFRRRHCDHRADGGELEIIELLEVQTALPHVEALPGFPERVDEKLFGERRRVLAGRAVVR